VLEQTGQMPRAEVIEYFGSLFRGRLQRKRKPPGSSRKAEGLLGQRQPKAQRLCRIT
jgi:hypothetical protein